VDVDKLTLSEEMMTRGMDRAEVSTKSTGDSGTREYADSELTMAYEGHASHPMLALILKHDLILNVGAASTSFVARGPRQTEHIPAVQANNLSTTRGPSGSQPKSSRLVSY